MYAPVLFISDTLQIAFAYQGRHGLRRRAFGRALKLREARDGTAFQRCLVKIAQRRPLCRIESGREAEIVRCLTDLLYETGQSTR